MKISNVGFTSNNKNNFKAHIVLSENPILQEVINESTETVGKKEMNTVLDKFKRNNPNVPVKFSVKKERCLWDLEQFFKRIVAKNLKNGEKADRLVQSNDDFYEFVNDLVDNRKHYDFWHKPETIVQKEPEVLEHNVFIRANEFDFEKYNKDCQDRENFVDEVGARALISFVKALKSDDDLQAIISDISEPRKEKPINKEKLQKFKEAYRDLCNSMRGNDWIK